MNLESHPFGNQKVVWKKLQQKGKRTKRSRLSFPHLGRSKMRAMTWPQTRPWLLPECHVEIQLSLLLLTQTQAWLSARALHRPSRANDRLQVRLTRLHKRAPSGPEPR